MFGLFGKGVLVSRKQVGQREPTDHPSSMFARGSLALFSPPTSWYFKAPIYLLGSLAQSLALYAYRVQKCKAGYLFKSCGPNRLLGPPNFVSDCETAISQLVGEESGELSSLFSGKGALIYPEESELGAVYNNFFTRSFCIPAEVYRGRAKEIARHLSAVDIFANSLYNFRFLFWQIPLAPPARLRVPSEKSADLPRQVNLPLRLPSRSYSRPMNEKSG